ncbi:hypothetical protein B9Z55_003444 [Caenorhabditis nigoni]|uniref:Poly(A) RNA polymerase mitochondrial-like central palm domain-containing protein n=1 Tax=Caenorhabditis nigoni TaxID=1611254 RepID=A0A2G5VQU3_9PELO|nr:hypothetical protein B9Z55_003444 [Caenorhabditis nigoni]
MPAKSAIERRLKRFEDFENDYSPNPNENYTKKWDAKLEEFSNDIEKYYDENRQTDEEKEQKLKILREIEDYLVNQLFVNPINDVNYEVRAVVPFGSSASALGMRGGDLDMIICVHPPMGKKQKGEIKRRTNDILREIFNRIQSGKMLNGRKKKDMEHIKEARVPIITGFIDGVEIDISISMTFLVSEQYLAAKMIDAYEKYDRRFILLAAFVKKWMKSKKTDENEDYYKTVFPNSCCTVLLVVFFMKQYKLLPNLGTRDPGMIDNVSWVKARNGENGSFGIPNQSAKYWRESNYCEVSLGTLFLLFLEYYAYFDFKTNKIIVEKGQLRWKSERDRVNKIYLQDVFGNENMTKSVRQVTMLQKCFRDAMKIVINNEGDKIEEELMEDVLPDVCSYSKSEMRKLRKQGLHFGPKPRKFEK